MLPSTLSVIHKDLVLTACLCLLFFYEIKTDVFGAFIIFIRT